MNKQKSLILQPDSNQNDQDYLITAESEESIALWEHAFELQIADCSTFLLLHFLIYLKFITFSNQNWFPNN